MNTKQILIASLLGFPLLATTAPRSEQEPPGRAHAEDEHSARIIIRSDAEKKRRQALRQEENQEANKNSNRQSDPDSARGLERAEERRPEQADAHAQTSRNDRGWYEYLFGKRQETGKKSERDWYGYLFGRQPKDDKPAMKEDDSDWWWPFD